MALFNKLKMLLGGKPEEKQQEPDSLDQAATDHNQMIANLYKKLDPSLSDDLAYQRASRGSELAEGAGNAVGSLEDMAGTAAQRVAQKLLKKPPAVLGSPEAMAMARARQGAEALKNEVKAPVFSKLGEAMKEAPVRNGPFDQQALAEKLSKITERPEVIGEGETYVSGKVYNPAKRLKK